MALEQIELPPVPLRTWSNMLKTQRALISAYSTLTQKQQVALNAVVWATVPAARELMAPDTELTTATAIAKEPGCFVWCTLRRIGRSTASLSFTTLYGEDNPFALAPLDAALDAADNWADERGGEWLRELKRLSELYRTPSPLSTADLGELQAYVAGMPD